MRFMDKTMSNELFEWICNQQFADRELIAMWRKPGYERLCCIECASDEDPTEGCACRDESVVSGAIGQ
jgi:bud site selection protein 31